MRKDRYICTCLNSTFCGPANMMFPLKSFGSPLSNELKLQNSMSFSAPLRAIPFSRARNSNTAGPPPLRSKAFPFGFPWLNAKLKKQVDLGNLFVDQTVEACRAAHEVAAAFFAEHPEDLGATDNGQLPASIFALDDVRSMCKDTNALTAAFHQCPWLAESSKPTRVVSTLDLQVPDGSNTFYYTWPVFDKKGRYLGPLPRSCGHRFHKPLVGRKPSSNGKFMTSDSASYPKAMCWWIVSMILRFCTKPEGGEMRGAPDTLPQTSATSATPDEQMPFPPPVPASLKPLEEQESSEEEEPGIRKPLLKDFLPGAGPPMRAVWAGKSRELNDGLGLCSPGRWLPKNRHYSSWNKSQELATALLDLLHKELGEPARVCMKLACGKFLDSPFPAELVERGRDLWASTVAASSVFSKEQLLEVAEYQPFLLKLIGETLRLSGDPDWRIFYASKRENFVEGASVGPGTIMPRTPAVFERKLKFKKYDESDYSADTSNYKSAAGPVMSAVLEKQFGEEALLGMMFKTSLEDAKREFSDLRIAAQGAIQKGDDSWRVLHDATHHVQVNNQTAIRDQIRMPGAGDQRTIMQESAEHDEGVHFTLQFDVSKAHRRYLHKRRDWGLLGCRSNEDTSTLWLNRVGTFGFTCASYWWARLASAIGRMVLRFFGRKWVVQLLFADDNRLQSNGKKKYDNLLLALFLWILVGTPLSWHKCKGGLSCEWVGYWVDYQRFSLGISESRCLWLVKWGQRVVSDGLVQMRDFAEGLGRLGFCSGVLEYYRPFLSPLFAWSAAAPPSAVLKVPPMVRLTLSWIVERLRSGRRTTICKRPTKDLGLLFKTDTKAEADFVVLGGWDCRDGTSTQNAKWFSLRMDRADLPWLFEKGHGSRTIGASELLSTLLAVFLFVPVPAAGTESQTKGSVRVQGLTDNQSNAFIVSRLMTSKFPGAAVLMQLTEMLSERELWLDLTWCSRTENTEADSLTNEDFSLFTAENRLPVVWSELKLDVLESLMKVGTSFLAEIQTLKEAKRLAGTPTMTTPRKRRRVKSAWEA